MLEDLKQGYKKWCVWMFLNHFHWKMDEHARLPTHVHLFTRCQLAFVR